jgi:hypothetical protein
MKLNYSLSKDISYFIKIGIILLTKEVSLKSHIGDLVVK